MTETPFVATLVIDAPITKLDALDVIAFVADGSVENAGTARPTVALSADAWAEVEVPRFADPPPLAVDVYSTSSLAAARAAARRLAVALENVGWRVRGARRHPLDPPEERQS